MSETEQRIRCRYCKELFLPRKTWQSFCSTVCRDRFWKTNREPVDLEKSTNLKYLGDKLRELPWAHPFVVMCRKAIECRKSQQRKVRNSHAS